jgi:transcription antitermination factor NusG
MNWFIYYTYPKAEKAILKEFEKSNFEVFLPLIKVKRKWSDRIKILDTPLFPNYIFIKSNKEDIYKIIKHPKIVKYVAFEGRPAVLKDEEICLIRKLSNNYNDIKTEGAILVGDKVKIKTGSLEGFTGTLIEQKGSTRFGIKLHELNQTISIEISLENIERIRFIEPSIIGL